MWRKPINMDESTQEKISDLSRKMTRRTFLNKFAQSVAGLLAIVLIKPIHGLGDVAFAAGSCYPPHGQYCSGCGASGSCPSGYSTCTSSNGISGCTGLCPYTSGWWYTSDPVGQRAKCQDCKTNSFGPPSGGDWCDAGAKVGGYVLCGCKSTTLY